MSDTTQTTRGAWKRFAWPTWAERKRTVYRQAWAAVIISYIVFLPAWLMRDSHDEAGWGRSATWPVNSIWRYLPIPGWRIDHVYLIPQLGCTNIHTGRGTNSDHRPLMVELVLRQ